MAVTGNGELGFDSGEGALETATTSKDGSRRANCPIATLLRQRRGIATSGALALRRLQWMISKPVSEYQLVDKSGASTRGNSSTNSVY